MQIFKFYVTLLQKGGCYEFYLDCRGGGTHGFTLAEVLITLGIIGIVASLILSSLVNQINNKGYAERLIKTYSVLQNVTAKIIEEEGSPKYWQFVDSSNADGDSNKKLQIIEFYKKHLNVVEVCNSIRGKDNNCVVSSDKVKTLNNEKGYDIWGGSNASIWSGYTILLADGAAINFRFKVYPYGVYWTYPSHMLFVVDVNGKKAPNKIGRDVFLLYMDENSGKVLPYGDKSTHEFKDTCDKNNSGHSCAYRIITEGKMNY